MRWSDVVTLLGSRFAATFGFAGNPAQAVATRTTAARSPVRLTPRGRMVTAGVSALLVGALSMTLATAAQAAHDGGHAGSRAQAAGRYLARVTVRPGDSLYSLAETYDPDTDPRAVVQRVLQLNSLSGDQIQPGEVLWLPRD